MEALRRRPRPLSRHLCLRLRFLPALQEVELIGPDASVPELRLAQSRLGGLGKEAGAGRLGARASRAPGHRPRCRCGCRERCPRSRSLQSLDDGDLPPVGVIRTQAVHVEAAVPGQAAHHGTEGQGHTAGSVSVLVHVGRQRPPARGHFLADARVDAQLGGQLALDGGSALELVVDVHAEPSPGLLELRGDVRRPLGSVSSELTHLPTDDIVIYSPLVMNAR